MERIHIEDIVDGDQVIRVWQYNHSLWSQVLQKRGDEWYEYVSCKDKWQPLYPDQFEDTMSTSRFFK